MEENNKRNSYNKSNSNANNRSKNGNSSKKTSQRGKSNSISNKSKSANNKVKNNRNNGQKQSSGKSNNRQNSRNKQNSRSSGKAQNSKRTINENFKPWDLEDNSPNKKKQTRARDFTGAIKDSVGKMSKKVLNNDVPDETIILNESDLKAEFDDGFFVDEYALKNKRRIIKERREGKKRPVKIKEPLSKRQRQLRNIAVSASIICIVLIVGVILSLTVLFTCENIEVSGVTKYKQEDIISKSGLSTGENLFLSDRTTGENNIKNAFPYVEDVKVSIKVPNTMEINITEAKPAYFIKDGNGYIVISDKGRMLEHTDTVTGSVPVITGCKLTSNKIGDYAEVEDQTVMPVLNEIASSLINNDVKGIKEINLSDMANAKLNYEDRINIILGVPEDVDYKIRIAMKIINENLALTDKGDLDVSNSKGENNASYFKPDLSIVESTDPTNASNAAESGTNPTAATDSQNTSSDYTPDDYQWSDYTDDYSGDGYSDDGYTDDYADYGDYSGDYLE